MTRFSLSLLTIFLLVLNGCKNDDVILGDRLFEQGRFRDAIKAYDKYLELQPTHVKSIYNRGRAYEELGEYSQALANFKKALDIDKKSVNAYLSIGNHHYRQERFDIAAYNYEKAVELNDSQTEARYLWGKALHQLGKFTDAMKQYNFAISLNKEYGDAYFHRGILYVAMKNSRKACADIKSAVALDVTDAKEALAKYCQ